MKLEELHPGFNWVASELRSRYNFNIYLKLYFIFLRIQNNIIYANVEKKFKPILVQKQYRFKFYDEITK